MEMAEIELMVAQTINSIMEKELPHELGKFLFLNWAEQIELFSSCGVNVNDPALAEENTERNGDNFPGGQCLAGECGKLVVESFRDNLPLVQKEMMGEEGISRYLSKVAGFILIFQSNIALDLYQWHRETGRIPEPERVQGCVTINIGHEYRHSFQSADMVKLEVFGFKDSAAYDVQPHEQDANIFAYACLKGWCRLADAPSWQPTAEQREEALQAWVR